MTSATLDYQIVTEDDAEFQRIIAVDSNDVQIVGAYRTQRLNDWMLYSTRSFADAAGMPQPHKVHVVSRQDVVKWVDLLASLYMKAVSQ